MSRIMTRAAVSALTSTSRDNNIGSKGEELAEAQSSVEDRVNHGGICTATR